MTVRVVIAEDHPMFREGLRAWLSSRSEIEVVEAVAGGNAAVAAVQGRDIDVAVLDLAMPDGDGWAATAQIRAVAPGTRVLVLTSFDSEREVAAALDAGAHGYVLKTATPEEIVEAVLAVAAGSAVLSDAVLQTVARRGRSGHAARPFPELTDREFDVLVAIADGLDNAQIAGRLGLSLKTVRNYVSNVLVKLMVRDRAAAAVEARRQGLGS
jgi:DNA-binding NarL/FixJ family response regulator